MQQIQNLFGSDLRLPEKVCIVAPGTQGAPHYRDIPRNFFVLAVSKAVLIPEISADIWMMNHSNQEWWDEAVERFTGIFVLRAPALRPGLRLGRARAVYCYEAAEEQLHETIFRSLEGVIRFGATVTGCALQLAYNFGAREILLCGADMTGDGYWDGTANPQPTHGETWPAAPRLNPVIEWMTQEKGIKISSLSPTKLKVPRFQNAGQLACATATTP